MKTYYIDGFISKERYHMFIGYMLAHSDAFSVVFFRYKKTETLRCSAKKVKKLLSPYKIFNKEVTKWPSMETWNQFGNVYELFLYRADMGALDGLEVAGSLWDWDYPEFPMDLCFYRDGYAWFASSIHEEWNCLYCDEGRIVEDLRSIGLSIVRGEDVDKSELFYDFQGEIAKYMSKHPKDMFAFEDVIQGETSTPTENEVLFWLQNNQFDVTVHWNAETKGFDVRAVDNCTGHAYEETETDMYLCLSKVVISVYEKGLRDYDPKSPDWMGTLLDK